MNRLMIASSIVFAALALQAADKKKPAIQASCNIVAKSTCLDYAGVSAQDLATSRSDCAKGAAEGGLGGSWAEGKACPTGGRVGRCVHSVMGMENTTHTYSGTAAQAQTMCQMSNGVWTPG